MRRFIIITLFPTTLISCGDYKCTTIDDNLGTFCVNRNILNNYSEYEIFSGSDSSVVYGIHVIDGKRFKSILKKSDYSINLTDNFVGYARITL